MRFTEYVAKKLLEGLEISDVQSMIISALGGNPNSKDAINAPLTQFAEPNDLLSKLSNLKGLEDLIQNSPSAIEALQNADQNNLTVNQLAAILSNS